MPSVGKDGSKQNSQSLLSEHMYWHKPLNLCDSMHQSWTYMYFMTKQLPS